MGLSKRSLRRILLERLPSNETNMRAARRSESSFNRWPVESNMLYDDVEDPEATSAAELRADYEAELAAVVETHGADAVAEETGVDRETVAAVADGDGGEIEMADAAKIAALADEAPPADAIVAEIQDTLLMGMTTAVLDVDTIAAEMDADMDGKQIQQKIEGRAPMTLDEYARLNHFIASRQRH
jgi:hypothetical protein